uniref:TAZ-type domain-containing protein n=1 Tax=Macrostomum lignano TaxID=282301 RepID=A0A1I8F7I8_9PLAT
RFGRLINELHPDGRGATATDPAELAERLRRTRHDLALLRTDLKSCASPGRHCLHSVDQMFTDTLAIVQRANASRKNQRRDSSPATAQPGAPEAYRLESRAIDTRLFELEQLVEELRSGTHPAGSESAAQRSATAAAAGISDYSAASGGLDGGAAQSRDLTSAARSVGKRRLPAEALRRISPSNNAPEPASMITSKKSLGRGTRAQNSPAKADAQLPSQKLRNTTMSPSPPSMPSTSAGISVAISAARLRRLRRFRCRWSPQSRCRESTRLDSRSRRRLGPGPQVAFSDTVKVDDGSQVIKLNWADASERACRCTATASAAKSPTSGSPRTPPPPPPRKSSTGGTGVTSSPLGGPGSRQRPSDYENVVGRVRPGSQAEEDAEQVWQRQSTVHFRSRSDSDRPPGVGIGNAASCHSGDATADHAAERFGGAQLERISTPLTD